MSIIYAKVKFNMVAKNLIKRSKDFLSSPQSSILSAATIIMLMIVASRILGLVRQRILAHYFVPETLSLFFAAFRLPDLVFEVLVFGTFSSAFIPVFTTLIRKDEKEAWKVASSIVNISLAIFVALTLIVGFFAPGLYGVFAPGFSDMERLQIVFLTRILFAAQGFFVVSYVLTGVLESSRRFLIPALAPIFYNLGIILGTLIFAKNLGLLAPALGVVVGAFSHFIIQLPLAIKLGFRFSFKVYVDEYVKKIGKLALPRIIEVSFLQLSKFAELFFSSLVSTASYTFYTFGNSLQLLPVGLFGISIAKAALPTLSLNASSKKDFSQILWKSLFEMTFLITPLAVFLIVLRIPIVRLIYGTDIFTWEATVQTSMVVSAFAIGIVFQASSALLTRAFYALHDTKTPVIISICSILLTIFFDFVFIAVFDTHIWGLAAAFSIGAFVQALVLYIAINKRLNGGFSIPALFPFLKHVSASLLAGAFMFFFLKFFDRSVWVKRLSFLGRLDVAKNVNFEKFVLDTRYTFNLLILTVAVFLLGILVYIVVGYLWKTKELWTFFNLLKRLFIKRQIGKLPERKQEQIMGLDID